MKQNKLVYTGVIVAAHGIKGHAIICSFTEPDTNICSLPIISESGENISLTFLNKNSKNQLICKVNDYSNRNDIEKIIGTKLYCIRNSLPITDDDEYYIEDLKGLKVLIELTSKEIGIIKNIHNYGAGDIIEIVFYDNKVEYYPFTKEFFGNINDDSIILKKRLYF